MNNEKTVWEEFDKLYNYSNTHPPYVGENGRSFEEDKEALKAFIRSHFVSKEELREKIEGLKLIPTEEEITELRRIGERYPERDFDNYNKALDAVLALLNEQSEGNADYGRNYSHFHCWKQGGKPACGQELAKHTQCCLCDTPYEQTP